MQPTLLILAAGRGSRFGGAKQVAPMGPSGETIMEYSIYDALRNGFGDVVLVINKEVEKETFELVEKMTDAKSKISYAYQDLYLDMIPVEVQAKRLKPWGTAHAIMSAADKIQSNFAMINADDYYGSEAFGTMADFLQRHTAPHEYSMVGYDLVNTLSLNGTVSRGVAISNAQGQLTSIIERHGVHEKGGKIYAEEDGQLIEIEEGLASMNFWGFQQSLLDELKTHFRRFLKTTPDLTKDECLIPTVVDDLVKKGLAEVSVLHSDARWFGVTYKEDQATAAEAIQKCVNEGKYPDPLWG